MKTAVITYVRKHPEAATPDVAASFQEAVVDVLVEKTRRRGGCRRGPVDLHRWRGGRQRRAAGAHRERRSGGWPAAFVPSRAMCTDNAAMVGATAWYRLRLDGPTPLAAAANPNLRLPLEG